MAGVVFPAVAWMKKVSQRKAPGAISAIAFAVRPVKPNVACILGSLFSAIEFSFNFDFRLSCERSVFLLLLQHLRQSTFLVPRPEEGNHPPGRLNLRFLLRYVVAKYEAYFTHGPVLVLPQAAGTEDATRREVDRVNPRKVSAKEEPAVLKRRCHSD